MDVKNSLAQTLEHLMQTKGIDEIYVRDIVRQTGISRQTFYRHFLDKYDLLHWTYQDMFDSTVLHILNGKRWSETLLILFNIFEKKQVFLKNAFTSHSVNSLRQYNYRTSMHLITTFMKAKGADIRDPDVLFMLDVYISGCTEVMIRWIASGMKTPKEIMVARFKKSWPGMLEEYID